MEDEKNPTTTEIANPAKAEMEAISGDQMMDILLVLDKEQKNIQAVKGIGKDGKPETVPVDDKHQNSFLKIDKSGNMLENFFANFMSQVRNPTRFDFFRIPLSAAKESLQIFKQLLNEKRSKAAEEYAARHRVMPIPLAEKENNKLNPSKTEKQMETAAVKQETPQVANTESKNRYNESMINWDELKHFGISREDLEKRGLLDGMLKGYKSNQTIPISMNFGSAILKTDARLSFQQSSQGPVVLAIHGIRKEPELSKPFFGHIFSEEDKKNLLETGNMGRVAELKGRNGEYIPSLISVDKLTNEIVALRLENVFVPNEVKGITLSEQEKTDLKEGKAIWVEGMESKAGKEFSAFLQVNAERRGIEYRFPNENKQSNLQIIGGMELSPKQSEDLKSGKAIFVENMKRKDGETFSSFIKLDEVTGKPYFTRYNPDSPEGAREIYIPNSISGTALSEEEKNKLREGKTIYLDGMVNRKGEEFASFIKADLETGKLNYSRTPDGFNEQPRFNVPQEVWGVTLTPSQRAGLQDGRSVLVENMTGYDGSRFSSYLKVNQKQGKLDYYSDNPDKPKVTQKKATTESKKQTVDTEKKAAPKKTTGKKL